MLGERVVPLDRHHLGAAPRKDRRRVAGSRADLEDAFLAFQFEQRRHARDDPGLRHRLPLADRHGAVAVRLAAHLRREEALARHLAHRAQDALVLDATPAQLPVDHPLAGRFSRCSS